MANRRVYKISAFYRVDGRTSKYEEITSDAGVARRCVSDCLYNDAFVVDISIYKLNK